MTLSAMQTDPWRSHEIAPRMGFPVYAHGVHVEDIQVEIIIVPDREIFTWYIDEVWVYPEHLAVPGCIGRENKFRADGRLMVAVCEWARLEHAEVLQKIGEGLWG